MSTAFAKVLRKVNSPRCLSPAVVAPRLLSITIDPEYDQPAILRAYGEALGADFNRWRFATGTPAEIERLRASVTTSQLQEVQPVVESV